MRVYCSLEYGANHVEERQKKHWRVMMRIAMSEYDRLKAEKNRILKAQEDAKDKRIAELETALRDMLYWFGEYPERIPVPFYLNFVREVIAEARKVLAKNAS
jgi:hypothetical protein